LAANGAVEEPYFHDTGVPLGGDRQVHVAGEFHIFAGSNNLDISTGRVKAGSR